MSNETHSFIALQKEMHEALRLQHPEWVQPDGTSPICDAYEARFVELLQLVSVREGDRAA